jgi:hypothetical protein
LVTSNAPGRQSMTYCAINYTSHVLAHQAWGRGKWFIGHGYLPGRFRTPLEWFPPLISFFKSNWNLGRAVTEYEVEYSVLSCYISYFFLCNK